MCLRPLSVVRFGFFFSYRRMIQLAAYTNHHLFEIGQLVENSKGQSFSTLVSHEEGNNNVAI